MPEATVKKYLTVQSEGNRQVKRLLDYYNLDMIISVGYRIKSHVATQFRIWATQLLKEYITKGFVMDDEWLKNGRFFGKDYFRELLERVRSIRASERRIYQQIADIFRTFVGISVYSWFLVSLTLALALSKMASRKVRVDSLFLDEGFGTLDEEALETALETLSGLQQDGKLIGIISHISALKERISTQINITPVSGGRSSLSGPGCTRGKSD